MGHDSVSSLLVDAPVNRHFAQLHRTPQSLTEAVALFVETGLRRGNGVVVVATRANMDLMLMRLRENELEPSQFLKSGKLELHDVELTLRKFMRNDEPVWEDFRRAMSAIFERLRAFGRGTTRAYGEMVNVLWHEGREQAAIRVEEYWNELGRLYPFSLFCGYLLDPHHEGCYSGPLEEIGRTHTDIIGSSEDDQFRAALDAASQDVLGVPVSQMVGCSPQSLEEGQGRLPSGQRTMLWVKRNLPSASTAVLERARLYYEESHR